MLLTTLLISLPLASFAAEPKIKPCTAYDPINDNFFNLAPLKAARDYTFRDEASDSGHCPRWNLRDEPPPDARYRH